MVRHVTNGKRATETQQFGAREVLVDRYPADQVDRTLIVHGPWECADLLAPIGYALQGVGRHTAILELPGCGRSLDASVTEYADWVALVSAWCAHEQALGARRITLLGIGLGGTLAYFAAAAGAPIDRLVVTALADGRERPLRDRCFGATARGRWSPLALHWRAMLDGHARTLPPRISTRVLCADPAVQAQLDVDPRCVPMHSARLVSSIFATAPAVEPEAFKACPVIVIAPTADAWLQLEPTLDFYRRLRGSKQLHMLEGSGHLPIDPASINALQHALERGG